MKKILKIAFTLLVGLQINNINAQDVNKNQSELIREKLQVKEYKPYASSSSKPTNIKIKAILQEKSQPKDHFQIITELKPNHPNESDRRLTEFFPDNIAFPVTYVKSYYEGNDKLQKKVGYSIRRSRYDGKERIIIVDDYLFVTSYWRGKNKYSLNNVYKLTEASKKTKTKKKKKRSKLGSFFSKLKNGLTEKKSPRVKGQEEINKLRKEILQPYLDKAFDKQKTYYTQWIKKAENKKTEKYIHDLRKMMKKAMDKYNDDIFNSPEYQRMLAYHRWLKNSVNMTVRNNTGRTIWVGSTREAFITNKVENGRSITQTCTSDLYYYYSNAKGTSGRKFYSGNSKCGKTVTIN